MRDPAEPPPGHVAMKSGTMPSYPPIIMPDNMPNDPARWTPRVVVYAHSRGIPLAAAGHHYGIPLGKLLVEYTRLKNRGTILINSSHRVSADWSVNHMVDPRYGKIYDALVPQLDPALIRIDDVGPGYVRFEWDPMQEKQRFGAVAHYNDRSMHWKIRRDVDVVKYVLEIIEHRVATVSRNSPEQPCLATAKP